MKNPKAESNQVLYSNLHEMLRMLLVSMGSNLFD